MPNHQVAGSDGADVDEAPASETATQTDNREKASTAAAEETNRRAQELFKMVIDDDDVYAAVAAKPALLKEICRFMASA